LALLPAPSKPKGNNPKTEKSNVITFIAFKACKTGVRVDVSGGALANKH
jgi:hypothetical protein